MVSVLINRHTYWMITSHCKNFWVDLCEKIGKITKIFGKSHLQNFVRDEFSQTWQPIHQNTYQATILCYFKHSTIHPLFRTELASFSILVITSQAMTSSDMTTSVIRQSERTIPGLLYIALKTVWSLVVHKKSNG